MFFFGASTFLVHPDFGLSQMISYIIAIFRLYFEFFVIENLKVFWLQSESLDFFAMQRFPFLREICCSQTRKWSKFDAQHDTLKHALINTHAFFQILSLSFALFLVPITHSHTHTFDLRCWIFICFLFLFSSFVKRSCVYKIYMCIYTYMYYVR